MLRGLAVSIGLVGTVAVRRSSAKIDDVSSNPSGVTGAMHSIMSLLQQHEGRSVAERSLAMARSLEEMDVTTKWSGVTGNLSEVVRQMQQDVMTRIEMGSTETQKLLDTDVSTLRRKADKAESSKSAANQQDKMLQTCIQQEKQAIEATVAAENAYNIRTAETKEPCQREINTATFSSSSGGAITIQCDTGTDPKCEQAKATLAKQLSDLQSRMFEDLDSSASNHKTAEEDCAKALKAQSDQLAVVKGDQSAWLTKHSECAGLEVQRDVKICHFGENLQEVCDAKADYDALVTSTQTSGNANSVEDRVAEWRVTQLVVCLLDNFLRGGNITDQSVEACQNSAPTKQFDLNLKGNDVQSILDVPNSPTFKIACKDGEALNFHGGKWTVPSVHGMSTGYDGQVPSTENSTLAQYQFVSAWNLTVSLSSQTPPFTLAECNTQADPLAGDGTDDAEDQSGDGKGGPM